MRELRLPYLYAVAPMKERLYGRSILPQSALLEPAIPVQQLNAALSQRAEGEIVDLLPALCEGRRDQAPVSRGPTATGAIVVPFSPTGR